MGFGMRGQDDNKVAPQPQLLPINTMEPNSDDDKYGHTGMPPMGKAPVMGFGTKNNLM